MVPLRPLTVADVLEGALGVFRRHWQLLVSVAAASGIATAAASVPYVLALGAALRPLLELDPEGATRPDYEAALDHLAGAASGLAGSALLSLVVSLVGTLLVVGAAAVVTGQAVLGRPAPWSLVRQRLLDRMGALIGTGALLTLVGTLVVAAAVMIPLLLALTLGWLGVLLGLLVMVTAVPVILVAVVRWSMAVPAAVIEGAGPVRALRRSWWLVQGHWWRTAGLLLLLGLIYGVISTVVSTPVSFVAQLGGGTYGSAQPVDAFVALMLLSLLATAVTTAVVTPFVSAAVAVKYLDLRMRKEGLAEQLIESARDA